MSDLRMTDDERERVRARIRAATGVEQQVQTSGARRARIVLVAASVVVIGGVVAVGAGLEGGAERRRPVEVASGPEVGAWPSLREVAERAGSTPQARDVGRYRHLVVERTEPDLPDPTWTERAWVAGDGTGRFVTERSSAGRPGQVEDRTFDDPADPVPVSLTQPGLLEALGRPGVDVADLERAVPGSEPSDLTTLLIDVAGWPDVDPAVRFGAFSLLHDLGFEATGPASDASGRDGIGFRGPGPNGSTVTFIVAVDTTEVLGWSSTGSDPVASESDTSTAPVATTVIYVLARSTDTTEG